MPKILSRQEVEAFQRDGFHFPVRAFAPSLAADYRRQLESFERETGAPLQGNLRHKTHLLFTWADAIVHHPRILDAIEDVIGPNILCWNVNFFIKEASSPGFVSWHQDATYWGLDPIGANIFLRGRLRSACVVVVAVHRGCAWRS